MTKGMDRAADELYGAPLDAFVDERKRLARALRDAGEKEAAQALLKAAKPTASAWAVNQLYRAAGHELDALLAASAALRSAKGSDFATALAAQRDALARLRERGGALLAKAGAPANETILRRMTTTLQALAAHGSFAPDPPGRLTADRDPPGFDVGALAYLPAAESSHSHDAHEPGRAHPHATKLKKQHAGEQNAEEKAGEQRTNKNDVTREKLRKRQHEVEERQAREEGARVHAEAQEKLAEEERRVSLARAREEAHSARVSLNLAKQAEASARKKLHDAKQATQDAADALAKSNAEVRRREQ